MKASTALRAASVALLALVLGALVACGPGQAPSPETPTAPSWTGDPLVQTRYGAVRGFEDEADTWVWKAIPYAAPPVGELRWKAPRQPEPWEGVREETEFCSSCTQYDSLHPDRLTGSQDCLYLNVWRPQSDVTGLPVYVWIHGGGNSIGAAAQTSGYHGANLASRSNMVFVSMNYRLGPLGWFTHPALRSGAPGDELDDSGNYGTLDIIRALSWIRDNIEAFGGDPGTVMISGESAGAMNVLSLVVSPAAEGLFHRAMAQSTPSVSLPVALGEASAHEVLVKLLLKNGRAADPAAAEQCLTEMSNADMAEYLRSRSAAELFSCYDQLGWGLLSFPSVFEDGAVIASTGLRAYPEGAHVNRVPTIVGSNKEETKIFLFMDPRFVGRDELYQAVARYSSDLWKASGVDEVARSLSSYEEQPELYVYQFLWGAGGDRGESPIPDPWGLRLGAAHSLDVPFFLGNDSFNEYMTDWVFTEENRAGREALSGAMMAYVAQFARTGDPNAPGSGLPEWKPWSGSPGSPTCILFDVDGDLPDIEMSSTELTAAGVMADMRSELPEPLYSDVLRYLLSFDMTSFLIEDTEPAPDVPSPSAGPGGGPGPPPELTGIPETGTSWVYDVDYGTEREIWTVTVAGGEPVSAADCYVTVTSFDTPPERVLHSEQLGAEIGLTLSSETTWLDRGTLEPVKNESSTSIALMGLRIDTTTAFTCEGRCGAPLSVGQEWTYEQLSVPSMGSPMSSAWEAEVLGIQEITVPAGSYRCYKVVHSSPEGTRTLWWSADGNLLAPVKVMDEASWSGTETRLLRSYAEP